MSAGWMATGVLEPAFVCLQAGMTAFLLLHDWVPMGSLNNLEAARGEDSLMRRVVVTLVSGLASLVGVVFCVRYFGQVYPGWLETCLWVNYGVLLAGLLRAWWIPYLIWPEPERAKRYRVIFAGTHTMLPERNGISPNTLHVGFHLATVAILAMLFLRDRAMRGT